MAVAAILLACMLPLNADSQEAEGSAFDFDRYHDSWEIEAELDLISARHPSITKKLSLGTTWEGRNITALRVSDNPDEEEPDEPSILIMGAHHAYELPSAEVPMYILEFLVDNYATNRSVRTLVDSSDIWFVPLVNPDGHEYALQQDLNWRKNRRPIDADGDGTADGYGVDLNRNYGHLWGMQGVSHDPTSQIYCGPSAFSENETQAIRWLAQNQSFEISISYHTYGEQVMYPWGNGIDTVHPERDVLAAIADDLAERTGYTPMESKDLYYTTGDSDDWLYSDISTLPFTIELGTQRNVPAAELEALCLRNLDAALYAIEIAAEPEKALLPDWTFMVYMSADADIGLANEALVDINEMEVAGSTPDVNIVVLHDGRGTGDSVLYHIQKDPGGFNTAIISTQIDDLGEVIPPTGEAEMNQPGTMHDFVAWTQENYPAQKYLLSIWGHGDGVAEGFVPDKGARMQVSQIRTALGGLRLDIVGLDMCSMGHFEFADELVGIADIMIGSEGLEPLAGWDYRATLERLVLAPGTGPRQLAAHIVADYLAANPENWITQAALDMGVYEDMFLPLLRDFADVSLDFAHSDYAKIWPARNVTNTFVPEQDAVDLFQFLGNLRAANISGPVIERLDRLLGVSGELILASGSGAGFPNARTLAVHFPLLSSAVFPDYHLLGFSGTGWLEYLNGIRNPAARPFITLQGGGTVADTTAGPYNVTGTVTGYSGEALRLVYRVNGGAWQYLTADVDTGTVTAPVPGQVNGTTVEYYFLDVSNNITEPYEIKWGNTSYPAFTVSAYCDLAVADLAIADVTGLAEGNVTTFVVNCRNTGREPVTANVTLTLSGDSGSVSAGWASIRLGAGGSERVWFNWTAIAGSWLATAAASQDAVFDTDTANQEMSVWANVTGSGAGNIDLLEEYRTVIIGLVLLWAATMTFIALAVVRLRRRRRATLRRSMDNAREFLTTAEGLGGDMSVAALILAKAEAALAGNKLAESERLVSRAREAAMEAVGGGTDEKP